MAKCKKFEVAEIEELELGFTFGNDNGNGNGNNTTNKHKGWCAKHGNPDAVCTCGADAESPYSGQLDPSSQQ